MKKAALKKCVLMGCIAATATASFGAEVNSTEVPFDGVPAEAPIAEPPLPLSSANQAAIRSSANTASPNTPGETLIPTNRSLQQSVLESDLATPEDAAKDYPKGNPFAINRWHVDFQVTLGALYNDNVYVANHNRRGGFELSISPMVTLTLGDYESRSDNYLALAYQPTYVYYPDRSGLNTWENQILIDSQITFNKLIVGGQFRFDSQSGQSSETINDEAVGRVDRNIYDALIDAEYKLTGKISAETELEWLYYDYKNRIDSTDYMARFFLNYLIAPKIKLGPGYAIGYTDVENAPGQTYQQALVKATYAPTEKITVDARAGVEFRHFNGGGSSTADPIFSLGASYQPFVDTRFDLEAYRRQRSSADDAGQNYVATGASLAASQKLFQKFTLRSAIGIESSDYQSAVKGTSIDRNDTFYYGRLGLAYDFREWLSAEIYYLYRKNDSSAADRSFSQNISGLQVVFKF